MQAKRMITRYVGEHTHMMGLAGDVSSLDAESIERLDIVERVIKVSEPYKLSGRRFHPADTIIEVGSAKVGGSELTVMAGPCSIESEEQILSIAQAIKHSGATFLRGGAFKPRSSPYSFQGMGFDGLELLKMAREKTGLPIVTEIMSPTLGILKEMWMSYIYEHEVCRTSLFLKKLVKAVSRFY